MWSDVKGAGEIYLSDFSGGNYSATTRDSLTLFQSLFFFFFDTAERQVTKILSILRSDEKKMKHDEWNVKFRNKRRFVLRIHHEQ